MRTYGSGASNEHVVAGEHLFASSVSSVIRFDANADPRPRRPIAGWQRECIKCSGGDKAHVMSLGGAIA
jgi:hypothetical protein